LGKRPDQAYFQTLESLTQPRSNTEHTQALRHREEDHREGAKSAKKDFTAEAQSKA